MLRVSATSGLYMNFIPQQRAAASGSAAGVHRRSLRLRRAVCFAAALSLAGCAAVGPDYGATPSSPIPERWNGAHDQGALDATQLANWWAQFGDPVLDGLIADALVANTDLASARGKLQEARARRDLARAGLAPSVTASGNARRIDGSRETGSGASRDLFSAAFDARYPCHPPSWLSVIDPTRAESAAKTVRAPLGMIGRKCFATSAGPIALTA